MRYKLHLLHKSELEFLRENLNLTEEENELLGMVASRWSEVKIADRLNLSVSAVTKRKRALNDKINDFVEGLDSMVTIYVNGEKVTKDKLKDYEIKTERIKEILASKLTGNKEK